MKIVRNLDSGASSGGAGGTPKPDSGNQNNNPPPSGKTVSWEDHQRAVDDMHRFKAKASELERKFADTEKQSLEKSGEFKTLWEQAKADLETEREKSANVLKAAMHTHRFGEVKAEAIRQGLRPEAVHDLESISWDGVPVEMTDKGRFIASGVKERVDKLKGERPHWFTVAQAPRINGGGGGPPPGGGAPTKVTQQLMTQAEIDYRHGKISKQKRDETFAQYCRDNPRPGTTVQATE